MSDNDISMDVQLICYQYVVTYNKLGGMKPMVLISPWSYSLETIALHPVKKIQGMNPMGLSAPWSDSLDMISLRPERKISRDETNRN